MTKETKQEAMQAELDRIQSILDLPVTNEDAAQVLSALRAGAAVEEVRTILESLAQSRDVTAYYKPTDIPLKLPFELDGRPQKAVTLKSPTGADSEWFSNFFQREIGSGGEVVVNLKVPDDGSMLVFQGMCAERLSGIKREDLGKMAGPDYDVVCQAAYDFFTDPVALMEFQVAES